MAKINKTKSWFPKTENKIDKPLARLIKKKMEKTQISKIENEKGEITTDITEIQRIIRGYNKELYANKMDAKETDKILGKDYHSKFNHIEIENINRPVLVQDGGVEGHTFINSCESTKIAVNFGTTINGRIL